MIRTRHMTAAAFAVFLLTHPVSGGKDDTAKGSETSAASFQSTLQGAFNAQFGANSAVLNFLNGKMTNMVNNPTGFSPTALASMESGAIQQTALAEQNATKSANATSAAQGGNGLPSGVKAQVAGQITAAGANQESGELNEINIENATQQQSNYWNAVTGLGGVAAGYNPTGFAAGANSAGNTVAGLSQAYSASENAGALGQFAAGLGGGLGKGLASFGTGGLSMETGWGYNPAPSNGNQG